MPHAVGLPARQIDLSRMGGLGIAGSYWQPVRPCSGTPGRGFQAMSTTEQDLCRRYAANGDEQAFTALVNAHASMVLAVCRRVLGNHQDAEDATQAVFCILAKKVGTIDASRPLAPWLYRVASGLAHTALQ